MSIKNPFEVLIAIFHGNEAQFMKHAPDLHTIVSMRIAPQPCDDQCPIGERTVFSDLCGMAMTIPKGETNVSRHFLQQCWGWSVVGHIGRSK